MGLEEVKKAQREQRQTLSLWRSPFATLRVFAAAMLDDAIWLANYLCVCPLWAPAPLARVLPSYAGSARYTRSANSAHLALSPTIL